MKILVTGGCGFVGANLCLSLKRNKHKVFSFNRKEMPLDNQQKLDANYFQKE